MLEREPTKITPALECGVTTRSKQAHLHLSTPGPARRGGARNRSRGAQTAMWGLSVQSQGGVLRKILHDPPRTDSNHPRNAGVLSQLCPHTARPWDACAGEAGVTPPRAGQGAALGAFPEGCGVRAAGGSSDAGL